MTANHQQMYRHRHLQMQEQDHRRRQGQVCLLAPLYQVRVGAGRPGQEHHQLHDACLQEEEVQGGGHADIHIQPIC